MESVNHLAISRNENFNLNNDALINGILKQFQALQVNIELPSFDPERTNPIEFIKNFEKYCFSKNIDEKQKIIIVENALKGIARPWFDTVAVPFYNL